MYNDLENTIDWPNPWRIMKTGGTRTTALQLTCLVVRRWLIVARPIFVPAAIHSYITLASNGSTKVTQSSRLSKKKRKWHYHSIQVKAGGQGRGGTVNLKEEGEGGWAEADALLSISVGQLGRERGTSQTLILTTFKVRDSHSGCLTSYKRYLMLEDDQRAAFKGSSANLSGGWGQTEFWGKCWKELG